MERFSLKFKFFPNGFNFNNYFKFRFNKRIMIIVLVIVVIAFFINYALNAINPVFLNLIINRSNNLAVKISNSAIQEKMKNISYTDLITIEKDVDGKITMLTANTYLINKISNEISMIIQEKITEMDDVYVVMPLGLVFGSNILANYGPKFKIRILPIGTVATTFRSEFFSSGINQTLHKIYVDVSCNISIVTPFVIKSSKFVNSILVNEVVIVGEVPTTFYNFEGLDSFTPKDTMELVE